MPGFDSQKIVTNSFRSLTIDQFTAAATPTSNSGLYMYTAQAFPWVGSDANVAAPVDTAGGLVQQFQNMVFGKKIGTTDIVPMIKRYDWVSGTMYSAYAEDNTNMINQQFYVIINSGTQYDVFKCLYNNGGVPSVNPPALVDTFAADTYYQTADGYQWRYMYSFSNALFAKFATSSFVPVYTNANVSGNAVSGAIDVIRVDNGGALYNNFGKGQFTTTDIQVGGVGTIYGIANVASTLDNFYNGTYLVIVEGAGKGQFRTIVDYNISGNTKLATLDSPFTTLPDVTSQWEVSPAIFILADGKQTANCFARALINSASTNTVYAVEVLQRGAGYRFASANVVISPTANIANTATLHVVIPPPGGHGFNAVKELGGTRVGVSVTFANSEANTISTDNKYRTIGIIRDPQFANVQVNIKDSTGVAGSNGSFISAETIYQVNPMLLAGTVSINTSSATLTGTGTSFSYIPIGSSVFVNSGASALLGTVAGVTNTNITLTVNASFVSTNAVVSIATITNKGKVKGISVGQLQVGNVTGVFTANSLIVGSLSHATAYVNNYTVSGVVKTVGTFNQLNSYVGTIQSGVFIANELVQQTGIAGVNASGYFHSTTTVLGITIVYLYNETGIFNLNGTFVGVTSGATFNIQNKYAGDLVVDSGDVIYEENFQPIPRAAAQSELVKVVIEY